MTHTQAHQPISESLQEKLQIMSRRQSMAVLITVDSERNLDTLAGVMDTYDAHVQQTDMTPALNQLYANLTRSQAYEVAKLDYVKNMTWPGAKAYLIE